MPVITSLEIQKNDPNRVNVYLDGAFGFGAAAVLVLARNLTSGLRLSSGEIADLQGDDSVEKAQVIALNFLSYRPRSRREVENHLRRKKTEPEVTTAVVEHLRLNGLLNDRDFARYWVDNRQTFRPRGKRALSAEMRGKGVNSAVIDEVLQPITDEEPIAYQAALKRANSLSTLNEKEFLHKMVSFLRRRGFPYETAASVARRVYQEIHQDSL